MPQVKYKGGGTPSCIPVRPPWKKRSLVESSEAEILLVKWLAREFSKMAADLSISVVKMSETRSKTLFWDDD